MLFHRIVYISQSGFPLIPVSVKGIKALRISVRKIFRILSISQRGISRGRWNIWAHMNCQNVRVSEGFHSWWWRTWCDHGNWLQRCVATAKLDIANASEHGVKSPLDNNNVNKWGLKQHSFHIIEQYGWLFRCCKGLSLFPG